VRGTEAVVILVPIFSGPQDDLVLVRVVNVWKGRGERMLDGSTV